jgi:hypothetical protein
MSRRQQSEALARMERGQWDAEHRGVWRAKVRALVAAWEAADACSLARMDPPFGFEALRELEAAVIAGPQPWPGGPKDHVYDVADPDSEARRATIIIHPGVPEQAADATAARMAHAGEYVITITTRRPTP